MDSSPINPATFDELSDALGAEFVVELFDTFLEEAPRMFAELRAASADADADAFRRAAHSLKSNAATFGADALAALARGAELSGLTGVPERDSEALDDLESVYAAAAEALGGLVHG